MLEPRAHRRLLRRARRPARPVPRRRRARRHDASTPASSGRSARFDLDVELDAKAGEVVALLGPNGAGKSTVFRCLAGLLPIDDGRIELDGDVPRRPRRPTSSSRPSGARSPSCSRTTCCSPTSPRWRTWPSGCGPGASPRRTARARAAAWLERVGLADHAGHRPRAAVRRPGAAGRAGPGAGHRAPSAPARRAARRPRRRHPRRRPPRPAPPPRHVRRRPPARHPRSRRRLRARRPRRHPRGRAASSRPARWPTSPPSPARATSPTSSA